MDRMKIETIERAVELALMVVAALFGTGCLAAFVCTGKWHCLLFAAMGLAAVVQWWRDRRWNADQEKGGRR